MNKIMIVDDEQIVRIAFKSIVNWSDLGILIYEASNGRQALDVLNNNSDIEVIITDINMPIMDGITLISQIRNSIYNPLIIVLSVYDDYKLVRKAFTLGVCDYILKTDMTAELIKNMVLEAIKKRKAKIISKDNEFYNYTDYLYQLKDITLKNLLKYKNVSDFKNKKNELNINIDRKNIVICTIYIDDFNEIEMRYQKDDIQLFINSVLNTIYQILKINNNGECISISQREYVLFLSYINEVSLLSVRQKCNKLLNTIKESLSNYIGINVTIGVSDTQNFYNKISSLYLKSKYNADFRFFIGKNSIIFPEDVEIADESSTIFDTNLLRHNFISLLNEGDKNELLIFLNKAFSSIKYISNPNFENSINNSSKNDNKDNYNIEKIYNRYMELIYILVDYLNSNGYETKQVFNSQSDFYDNIRKLETCFEIEAYIINCVNTILDFLEMNNTHNIRNIILKAKDFINKNYSKDISLKTISEYVGLSESHFSNIFSKNANTTFIDYITSVRIEKAKKLLTCTNMKIYEISSAVGYSNIEHFSRVFKKVTGNSPSFYRNK